MLGRKSFQVVPLSPATVHIPLYQYRCDKRAVRRVVPQVPRRRAWLAGSRLILQAPRLCTREVRICWSLSSFRFDKERPYRWDMHEAAAPLAPRAASPMHRSLKGVGSEIPAISDHSKKASSSTSVMIPGGGSFHKSEAGDARSGVTDGSSTASTINKSAVGQPPMVVPPVDERPLRPPAAVTRTDR